MKKIAISLLLALLGCSVMAQELGEGKTDRTGFHFGVLTGLDLGAAVPWPISKAISGDDKMSATPKITPAIGLLGEYRPHNRWSVVMEATYKTVALDASIITLSAGQRFRQGDLDVLFFGKARMDMSFTMIEVPLYAKFHINHNNSVYLGGYYSFVLGGKFEAHAQNGRLQNPQTGEITIVRPDNPITQNFSENLDNWDAGFMFGYERRIFKSLSIAGRVSAGFKDIFKKGENYLDYSMWNMRGTINVIYRFM